MTLLSRVGSPHELGHLRLYSLVGSDICLQHDVDDRSAIADQVEDVCGEACSTIVTLFNPELLIVSGPVARVAGFLREPIEMRMKQDVMRFSMQYLKFVIDDYSAEYEAVGAALLAIQSCQDR